MNGNHNGVDLMEISNIFVFQGAFFSLDQNHLAALSTSGILSRLVNRLKLYIIDERASHVVG